MIFIQFMELMRNISFSFLFVSLIYILKSKTFYNIKAVLFMSKRIKLEQILKDHEYEYSQLKESILEIRQREKKEVYYITICKKYHYVFEDYALIFIRQSAKKTSIGLIYQCKKNIQIPLIDLPESQAELEVDCIDRVQNSQKQNQLFIYFKCKEAEMWKVKFYSSQVREKWLQLLNYKNSILKQEYNKHYPSTLPANFTDLQSSNTVTRTFLIKTKMQKQFESQLSQMSFSQINEVLEKQNIDFAEDKQRQRTMAEYLQKLQLKYAQLEQTKTCQQQQFKENKRKLLLLWEGEKHKIEELNKEENLKKELLWEEEKRIFEQLRNEENQKKQLLERENTDLKANLQSMENQHIQLQLEMKHLIQQKDVVIQSLTSNNNSLTLAQHQITYKLNLAIQQNTQCKQTNTLLEEKVAIYQQQILKTQEKEKEMNDQISILQTQLDNSKITHQIKLNEMRQLLKVSEKEKEYQYQTIQSLSSQIRLKSSLITGLEQNGLLHIFEREALSGQNEAKRYLMNQIQSLTHSKINNTKLLFFKDDINKINFHSYIDKHPNICLVVRTIHNHLVAGFSIHPLNSTEAAIEGGILVSMTNHLAYSCRESKRAITYDDFFLIFGNSQLRIRSGETILFSNFGIANGYYENKGDRVQKLIGAHKDREVQMLNYEIYQVIFQQ